MQEKFSEKFHVIRPDEYETIRKITDNDDVYSQFDQIISPMDSIKPLERRAGWNEERIARYNEERIYSIINSGWDLVVIDEAHRVAGSSGEVARYKLGNLLSAASPYLLLLTATPHNGKTEPFLRLIRLVDKDAFPNYKAIVKEQVAPYVIRTEKREAIDNNGNRLFKNRTTTAINLHWDSRHSLQQELYAMVTEYVAKNYGKALRSRGKNMWFIFLLIMMQRLVSSSTSAIRESIERRVVVLEQQAMKTQSMSEDEFAEMELEENMDDAIAAMSMDVSEEIKQLKAIAAIAQQAEFQYLDVKAEPLLKILDELYSADRSQKVIIFTEFIATQSYLSNLLRSHRYKTSLLNGSMDIEERNAVLKEFHDDTDILISTDAGGEGLNLQFSNCVINYDLPWNPMKIEQRIGRVDRIGQKHDVIAYNFILADTVEFRVKEVLEQKLSAILTELGVDKYSDVLDGEAAEINFTDAYMNSIRNPKNIDYSIKPIEDDLKQQVQNTVLVKDLIRELKDLQTLVSAGAGFDLDDALYRMVMYYNNYMGDTIFTIDHYTINQPIISRLLKKKISFNIDERISNVAIRDFPNEKGNFILWELSVADEEQGKRIIPIFINDNGVLRPQAGKMIWEALLDADKSITVSQGDGVGEDIWQYISKASQEFAYDTFLSLKDAAEHLHEEIYRKRMYAWDLRAEAAQRIGIDNIRKHKLVQLMKEKAAIRREFEADKMLCPEFKPIMVLHME